MHKFDLLIKRCIRIAGSLEDFAKYLRIPKIWILKWLNNDYFDEDCDDNFILDMHVIMLEMYDMSIKYGHKTMIKYKHGYYDPILKVGIHDNLGRIYQKTLVGAYGHKYNRFFFDKDKTNGSGICEYNIQSWFNRE